jgi:hypothetical protein
MNVDYFYTLSLVIGWTVAIIVAAFAVVIIWNIVTNKIDLSTILDEPDIPKKASLSRLQFLIFTFVISLSLFLVVVGRKCQPPAQATTSSGGTAAKPTDCNCCQGPGFPADIPAGIFALLGISGGTYLISKGVQQSNTTERLKAGVGPESRKVV